MRIVLYTVVVGDYDNLNQLVPQDLPCDYICFTDNPNLTSDFYRIILYRPLDHTDLKVHPSCRNIINAALYRSDLTLIHPLKDYDICIHLDANTQVVSPTFLSDVLQNVGIRPDNLDSVDLEQIRSEWDLVLTQHPWRTCVYAEAAECMQFPKYFNTNLAQQMLDYQDKGYPKNNGLYWNGFVFHLNPFSDRMRAFYDLYTQEMLSHAKDPTQYYHPQGQVILPYVLSQVDLKVEVCPIVYTDKSKIRIFTHKVSFEEK